MCPKLIELLSWSGPTVHVCCFMLARASTKTFVSRIHIRQPSQKTAKKIFVSRKIRQQGHSLAEVSLFNEISPAWRCIKRPSRTSVGDGYRAPGRHRLEYRVLALAVLSPGIAFNCRLYLSRSPIALKGLDTLGRSWPCSQVTNTQTGYTVTVHVVQTSR